MSMMIDDFDPTFILFSLYILVRTYYFIFISLWSGLVNKPNWSHSASGAAGDDGAAALVRVGSLPVLAVVVGLAAASAWHSIAPQGTVSNVPSLSPSKCSTAALWVHHHFVFFSDHVANFAVGSVDQRLVVVGGEAEAPAGLMPFSWWLGHHGQDHHEHNQAHFVSHLRFDSLGQVRTYTNKLGFCSL